MYLSPQAVLFMSDAQYAHHYHYEMEYTDIQSCLFQCKYFIDWCLCLLVGTIAVYRCQKNRVEGFGMLQIDRI